MGQNSKAVPAQPESAEGTLLEYKLAILHILCNISDAVTLSQLCDILLEKMFSNYFHLRQALSELEEAALIERERQPISTLFRVTPQGRETYVYLEKDLSVDIRRHILDRLQQLRIDDPLSIRAEADYETTVTDGTRVHCVLMEGMTRIIDMYVSVPGQEAAREAAIQWPQKARRIYERIMEELL